METTLPFPEKRPGVGCGAAILRGDAILLIERLRPPEAGHWGLPGGKVDWLEPSLEATRREVQEELGIRLLDPVFLCMVDLIDRAEGHHWVAPVFLARTYEGEPRLLEPEKHGGLDWFPLDRLPAKLTTPTRAALAALAGRPLAG
ncbi:MAG: NUDIX domain-containing protein [Geminicoccaceae bacterium]